MIVKEITYSDILPCWKKLWAREKYDPFVKMCYKNISCKVIQKPKVTFFGLIDNEEIVGCNSGFINNIIEEKVYYRSRGLYIDSKYRGKGYSKLLLNSTFNQAKLENADYCWSLPKKSALKAYTSIGFIQTSEFSDWEFGENCYVLYKIK